MFRIISATFCLAFAFFTSEKAASAEDGGGENLSDDSPAEIAELMTTYYVTKSTYDGTSHESFVLGSFDGDIRRCVEIFAGQGYQVELSDYMVGIIYAGQSVGYNFYPLRQLDGSFLDERADQPSPPSFRCVRMVEWGGRLLVTLN